MNITKAEKKDLVNSIINTFEDFLQQRNVEIKNDERTEASYETSAPEDLAIIYGSDYSDLENALLNLFKNDESRKTPPQQIAYYTKKEAEELELSKIGLSERVWHSLARSGFFFIKDVIDKSPSFLISEINGFGPKSMKELSENLYHFGITLPQD